MLEQIINVLPPIKGWLKLISAERGARIQGEDDALSALYTAVSETRLYIRSLENRGRSAVKNMGGRPRARDRTKEEQISRLWTQAAVKLRHMDHDLADRCYIKGDYWVNPDVWSDEDINRARIGIDQVFQEARVLL